MLESRLRGRDEIVSAPTDAVELLGRAMHRTRNLMMSIRGYAELIADGMADLEESRTWADKIVTQIDRLESMQTRVDVARHRTANISSHSLAMIVRAAVERSRCRNEDSSCAVELQIVEDVLVLADGEDLAEAIAAVIDNAREASAACAGEPVTVRLAADDSGAWALRIEDRGEGLGLEALPRLGEPFFTRKSGHLGLGVFLSRTLLERHGMELEFVQPDGAGMVAIIRERRTPSGGIR